MSWTRGPGDVEAPTDFRDRVFRALTSWASTTGLRKLSMGEVAQRAHVGRATLYKYFPGKDVLIAAFVRHELERFFADVKAVVEQYSDPDERIVHGFACAYRQLRDHPALGPVLKLNPDPLLPYVITDNSYALDLGRDFVIAMTEPGVVPDAAAAQFAEHFARALHTLILIPSTVLELDAPDGPERYARTFLIPVKNHLSAQVHAAAAPS